VLELMCEQVRCPGSKCLVLFPKLKEFMKGHKVSDDENVICTQMAGWKTRKQQFFYNGIRTLEKLWIKCISVAGEYVKK